MHFSARTFFASYLHQIGADYVFSWCYFGQACIKFGANSASKLKKIYAEAEPSCGAIWDEFSSSNIIIKA